MITEDYVSFEIAKLLKEKGFDEACQVFYDSDYKHTLKFPRYSPCFLCDNASVVANNGICAAPTLQMAMKWLREVHDAIVNVFYNKDEEKWCAEHCRMLIDDYTFIGYYSTYEQACEAAIKYCLEYLV